MSHAWCLHAPSHTHTQSYTLLHTVDWSVIWAYLSETCAHSQLKMGDWWQLWLHFCFHGSEHNQTGLQWNFYFTVSLFFPPSSTQSLIHKSSLIRQAFKNVSFSVIQICLNDKTQTLLGSRCRWRMWWMFSNVSHGVCSVLDTVFFLVFDCEKWSQRNCSMAATFLIKTQILETMSSLWSPKC